MPSSVIMTSSPKAPKPNLFARFWQTLELIKFSHSVFALPFALASMLVAGRGLPSLETLVWILWCLVSARTAAMAFNRWADWDYDVFNPRTKRRSQLGSRKLVLALCILGLIAFVFGAAQINPLCLVLSPVACLVILGYSLTKRFTIYSHAFLGVALAIAPIGAWAAVRGNLLDSALPWLMGVAVWCWVFGFDLIYATQDIEFDRQARLHSFPARYGVKPALRLALFLHGLTWLILGAWGLLASLSLPYWLMMVFVLGALIVEHFLSWSNDLQRLNVAFFQMNALVGLFLILGVAGAVYFPHLWKPPLRLISGTSSLEFTPLTLANRHPEAIDFNRGQGRLLRRISQSHTRNALLILRSQPVRSGQNPAPQDDGSGVRNFAGRLDGAGVKSDPLILHRRLLTQALNLSTQGIPL